MDGDQRRKRKRGNRPYSSINCVSFKSLHLLLVFGFFLFVFSHRFPLNAVSFRPVLSTHFHYSSSAATSSSLLDTHAVVRQAYTLSFPPPTVLHRVLLPDQLLVFFTPDPNLRPDTLDCVYTHPGSAVRPVISLDSYDRFRSVARCPLPPGNFSSVELRRRPASDDSSPGKPAAAISWDRLVYEAEIDGDSVVVFVKGLNLRPHQKYDPSRFKCRFGLSDESSLTTPAIAAGQEVIRCALPKSFQSNPGKVNGVRVTVSVNTVPTGVTLPSVARIFGAEPDDDDDGKSKESPEKHELCACTMAWNQASALKEWITYHSWLGVEKWFVYDNNSDDGTEDVLRELDGLGLNVTRRVWPWIKTQEAGFSHCALAARDRCKWVGFFDVDEYFYLPGGPGRNGLSELVANVSASSENVGEVRTECHSFGPSGLSSAPERGVTVGYTCRLKSPERHKSIVRPEMLDSTLLNAVHHFRLREGFRYMNLPMNKASVNHYKYQVWEKFRAKFYRRVATYVADWREDQNKGSKDRAPGLGTEPIEPPNWKAQFCEVRDNRLRDFVLAHFGDPLNGSLPWEDERSQARL